MGVECGEELECVGHAEQVDVAGQVVRELVVGWCGGRDH